MKRNFQNLQGGGRKSLNKGSNHNPVLQAAMESDPRPPKGATCGRCGSIKTHQGRCSNTGSRRFKRPHRVELVCFGAGGRSVPQQPQAGSGLMAVVSHVSEIRVAKKDTTCTDCNKKIPKGTSYRWARGLFDGVLWGYRICEDCLGRFHA